MKLLNFRSSSYNQLLKRGKVVQGEAVSVDGTGVALADGPRIKGDYIVLATGSSNLVPVKSAVGDIRAFFV